MSLVFLFWLSSVYTLVLLGLQGMTFLHPSHPAYNITTLNGFYLALLASYVGGKEMSRWKEGATMTGGRPLWLRGEWFVGLWAAFLLVAVVLTQLWPARYVYPEGLTVIAFEVLGFYVGSSASAWLHRVRETRDRSTLEAALENEPDAGAEPPQPLSPNRLSQKRRRLEERILKAAGVAGGITREDVEKEIGLSRAATGKLLSALVSQGKLIRQGEIGSRETRYQLP